MKTIFIGLIAAVVVAASSDSSVSSDSSSSSSSASSEVVNEFSDFPFLNSLDIPTDIASSITSSSGPFHRCAKVIRRAQGYTNGKSCSDVQSLCRQCSICNGFVDGKSASLSHRNCICVATADDDFSLGDKDDCVILPDGTAFENDIRLGAGNDCVIVLQSSRARIHGNAGDDTIILLNTGDDDSALSVVEGNGGDDCIYVNFRATEIYGNSGDDFIFVDRSGPSGYDYPLIDGGDGEDFIVVKADLDGPDAHLWNVYGGSGDDVIRIANGTFVLNIGGDEGKNDIVIGHGAEASYVEIGSGFNGVYDGDFPRGKLVIKSEAYVAYVEAGVGSDHILVHGSVDRLDGGFGSDEVDIAVNGYVRSANFYDGDDSITVSGHVRYLDAGRGNDHVSVSSRGYVRYLDLSDGNDTFVNSGNVTRVRGESGFDVFEINGGRVSDINGGYYYSDGDDDIINVHGGVVGSIYGNAGDDIIHISSDARVERAIYGDNGNDRIDINGHASTAVVEGGHGNDEIIVGGSGSVGAVLGDSEDYYESEHPYYSSDDKIVVRGKVSYINGGPGSDNITIDSSAIVDQVGGGDGDDHIRAEAHVAHVVDGQGGFDTCEVVEHQNVDCNKEATLKSSSS